VPQWLYPNGRRQAARHSTPIHRLGLEP